MLLGIAGILLDLVFNPKEVVISDLFDHIQHIQLNIQRNSCKVVRLIEYDWCNPPEIGIFEIILVFEW